MLSWAPRIGFWFTKFNKISFWNFFDLEMTLKIVFKLKKTRKIFQNHLVKSSLIAPSTKDIFCLLNHFVYFNRYSTKFTKCIKSAQAHSSPDLFLAFPRFSRNFYKEISFVFGCSEKQFTLSNFFFVFWVNRRSYLNCTIGNCCDCRCRGKFYYCFLKGYLAETSVGYHWTNFCLR